MGEPSLAPATRRRPISQQPIGEPSEECIHENRARCGSHAAVAGVRRGGQAQYPDDHVRRRRHHQPQCLQPRARGLSDAEHRPYCERGRAVYRLLRRAELHRRACGLHHRPIAGAHRADQGRFPRRRHRHPEGRPDAGRAAQAAGLRHRPIRQEPSGRPQRVPAYRARLRRVFRQPLPSERGGRAGEPGLSEESRISRRVRTAWCARLQGHRYPQRCR